MCGIIVSTTTSFITDSIDDSFEKISSRGPDSSNIVSFSKNLFMFKRLAIMGLSEEAMQPFKYKNNILVANAEIYNYKEIKSVLEDEYSFKSNSDCEVLLPLYDEIGIDMFSFIDAEFAIVLYDNKLKSIVAARDEIGIRPLFYGYSKRTKDIIFSSEVKGIFDLVEKVIPFPPGHYYLKGIFYRYGSITDVKNYTNDTFDVMLKSIKTLFTKAVVKRLDSDAEMGFLLSGGLDSSLVCAIASKHLNKKIKTFSIGMETDPIDLKYAKVVSDYLKTNHTEVRMSKSDVIGILDEVIYSLETYDITTIRASIGMFLLSKHIKENTKIKVLLTGEVSDELFGYKYTDYAPNEEEFQKEAVKRVEELYMYDVLRADRTLAANSLEARVPFGDIDFASYIMRINPIYKMNKYSCGKFLLRKAFEGDHLPMDILYRAKAAFSDAVGHSMVDHLKEYAERAYTDDEFLIKVNNYKSPTPFTKEALMYREIFEKYYPNHSHLIKDYWMPNKTWKNCDVKDPSARVLSNYGNSGL